MAVLVYVPSRLGEGYFTDVPAPTSGDDGKYLQYDHDTTAFVYATVSGGGTPGGSDTQVQFNDAGAFGADAGLTYAKATDTLTVAGGLVAPSIRPASDSTTHGWKNAAGTNVLTVDTTQKFVGVGVQPTVRLHVDGDILIQKTGLAGFIIYNQSATFVNSLTVGAVGNPNFISNWDLRTNVQSDITKPSWAIRLYTSSDEFRILRVPAGGAFANEQYYFIVNSAGHVALGNHTTTPTALLDLAASDTTRASLRMRSGTAPTTPNDGNMWNDGALVAYHINATTNAVVNSLRLRRGSSGTPAAGFGLGIAARLESSTTEDRDAGRLTYEWVTATDATRASRGKLTAFHTTTEQTAMTWDGDTGGLKLGFYDVTPVARQVLATGAGASVDDVITALQNLGLVKQS